MKLFLTITFLCIFSYYYGFGFSAKDSIVTAKISVVGDLMCHSTQFNYARVNKDSFDFNPVFREVKKYFRQSDFVFGNLETVAAGESRGYSGYPFFNCPDEYITAIYNAGFNLITTSNNHSLDQGEAGLLRTINVIKKNHLLYNGTFTSKEDRDSIRIINIKGIKIAFLAYSYGTNGIPVPEGKSYLINLIDFDLIKSDIKNAKKFGANVVLVHYHFGEEYKREPVAYQKEVVSKTISFGADIIIGGHPHVLEPVLFFKTNNTWLDSGFVAYSMGNFISNQRWRYSDAGTILNIEITRNLKNKAIHISNVSYIPTWVFRGTTNRGNEYVILPLLQNCRSTIDRYLTAFDRINMLQAFDDTNEILIKYSANINLYHGNPFIITGIKPRGLEVLKLNKLCDMKEVTYPVR